MLQFKSIWYHIWIFLFEFEVEPAYLLLVVDVGCVVIEGVIALASVCRRATETDLDDGRECSVVVDCGIVLVGNWSRAVETYADIDEVVVDAVVVGGIELADGMR